MTHYMRALGVLSVILCMSVRAYLDNPIFFPFDDHITWRTRQKPSCTNLNLFFMTSDKGRNEHGDNIWLPALGGVYDVAKINTALNTVGITNPYYPSEWIVIEIPYQSFGTVRSIGIEGWLEYAITNHFSLGVDSALMHVTSRRAESITEDALRNLSINRSPDNTFTGRERTLEVARLNAHNLLGVASQQWQETGLSDTELYLRAGIINDYTWKVKQYDLSLTLGGIFPTGQLLALNNAASIPFGGNGHWGIFLKGDANFELTDDIFAGFWLYGSKRFTKTYPMRLPVAQEPLQFGALIANTRVQPGWLIALSPYVIIDDIQDGFGAYGAYTFIHHFCSQYTCFGTTYTPNFARMLDASIWTNEFFTLGIDYDSTKAPLIREYGHRVFLDLVIPTNLFDAKRVSKTYRLSLGVEFHF